MAILCMTMRENTEIYHNYDVNVLKMFMTICPEFNIDTWTKIFASAIYMIKENMIESRNESYNNKTISILRRSI